MFVRARLVPRRVRTEARFRAADPWNGDVPAEFSIEAYYYVPQHVQEVSCPWRWCNTPLYALRSEDGTPGGGERFLPDALSRLWSAGKVSAEALPHLLREMEPELTQDDFQPLLRVSAERWGAAALIAVLLAILGLLVTWPRNGGGGIPVPALLCGGVVAGGLLGALFALPPYFARRERRRRQMGWALARLPGGRA
jgi:hypothetical protein